MPKTVLMCPPKYFDIEYEINPWMHKDNQVVPKEAGQQWQKLHDIYTQQLGWGVEVIEPVDGLPDMVFTANGGLVYKGQAILPRFRYPERQPETEYFKKWFEQAGYQNIYMPEHNFEGEGDGFIFRDEYFFGGSPFRSDPRVHQEISKLLKLKPISLELIDPRFYHLDTCFTIINNDTIALYPKAFSPKSIGQVKQLAPNVIEASDEDAMVYGLNAVSDGQNIVIPETAIGLIKRYQQMSLTVITTPIAEFQKSGGGVKCLTLELR